MPLGRNNGLNVNTTTTTTTLLYFIFPSGGVFFLVYEVVFWPVLRRAVSSLEKGMFVFCKRAIQNKRIARTSQPVAPTSRSICRK